MNNSTNECDDTCSKYISSDGYCVDSCGTEFTSSSGNQCETECNSNEYRNGSSLVCLTSCSGKVIKSSEEDRICIETSECKLSDNKFIYT